MRFETGLPFEQWQALGARLAVYSNASRWWLGDWLNFGREMFRSRYKLGVALTGLDYKTLRNYASIAAHFPLSRRRDSLSFQHHAEVAPLPPEQQELWLDRAASNSWSRTELRDRLRAELRSPEQPRSDDGIALVSVHVDGEHPWRRAAARCGCDLQSWIVRTLDEAASTLASEGPDLRAVRP